MDPGLLEFVGEIGEREKGRFLGRLRCRQRFQERFLDSRMAADYAALLARQVGAGARRPPRRNS